MELNCDCAQEKVSAKEEYIEGSLGVITDQYQANIYHFKNGDDELVRLASEGVVRWFRVCGVEWELETYGYCSEWEEIFQKDK